MNFLFYIAKRYVRSKSRRDAVNIINFMTFIVILIGSAALFIVLSGFSGLKSYSLSFTNMFDPDLKAVPATGKFFSLSSEQDNLLNEIEGVVSYSKEIEQKVLLQYKGKSKIASIKGVDKNYVATTKIDSVILGDWRLEEQFGVAGMGISQALGVPIYNNSYLDIITVKPGKGPVPLSSFDGVFNTLPVTLSGLYSVEAELDNKYVFIDLAMAQAVLKKDTSRLSGINFRIDPKADEIYIREKIMDVLEGHVVVLKNRLELNGTLHRMLNTENVATYLIFTFVLIIALFNLAGSIIMMILDKQENSRTLYSLGVTVKELRQIYFIQGVMVTILGGISGLLLGSVLVGFQLAFGWVKIGSIDYPVEFKLKNLVLVLATIILLGTIVSKFASSRISKGLIA